MAWSPEELNRMLNQQSGGTEVPKVSGSVSPEDLQKTLAGSSFKENFRRTLDTPGFGTLIGLGEAAGSLLSSIGAQIYGAPVGAGRSLFPGRSFIDPTKDPEYNKAVSEATYEPFTKKGQTMMQAVEHAYNTGKNWMGDVFEKYPPELQRIFTSNPNAHRTAGEVVFDTIFTTSAGRGGAKAGSAASAAAQKAAAAKQVERLQKARELAAQAEANKPQVDPVQMELFPEDSRMSYREEGGRTVTQHNPNLEHVYGGPLWAKENTSWTPEQLTADLHASARERNAAAREDMLDLPDVVNQRVRSADETFMPHDTRTQMPDAPIDMPMQPGASEVMAQSRLFETQLDMPQEIGTDGRFRQIEQAVNELNKNGPIEYTREDRLRIARAKGQSGALDLFSLRNLRENLLNELQTLWSKGDKGKRFELLSQQLKNVETEIEKAEAPRDPFKGPGGKQAGAVKLPGGNWTQSTWEEIATPLLMSFDRHMGELPQQTRQSVERLLTDWTKRVSQSYMNKYLGTSKDPLKDIEIPYGEGTLRWEDITDQIVLKGTAKDSLSAMDEGFQQRVRDGRLPYSEPVWGLATQHYRMSGGRTDYSKALKAFHEYLEHVADYIRENVPPQKLTQYDLVRAVQETARRDAEVAKKMAAEAAEDSKYLPTHKAYPDGYRWVELRLEGEKLTSEQAATVRPIPGADAAHVQEHRMGAAFEAFDAEGKPIVNNYTKDRATGRTPEEAWLAGQLAKEGNQMGHCVGGYCEDVLNGTSQIYSLRDPQGRSHVTVEVTPTYLDIEEFYHTAPKEIQDQLPPKPKMQLPGNYSMLDYDQADKAHNRAVEDQSRAVYQWMAVIQKHPLYIKAAEAMRPSLQQVKGKQNQAPKSQYLPYVRDFVKNKEWADVHDLENVGLLRVPSADARMEPFKEYKTELVEPSKQLENEIIAGYERRMKRDRVPFAEQVDFLQEVKSFFKSSDLWNIQRLIDTAKDDIVMARREAAEKARDSSTWPGKDPFKGPGKNQAGAINFGGKGPKIDWSDVETAVKQAARSMSFDDFEKELIKNIGPEAKQYAQSLYNAHKGPAAAATSQTQGVPATTGSAVSAGKTPAVIREIDTFNRWDRREPDELVSKLHKEIESGTSQDTTPRPFYTKQGQSKGRRHEIMGWTYDRIDWTEREVNMGATDILYGWNFGKSLFGSTLRNARRRADPDSAMYQFRRLNADDKEAVIDVLQEFNGVKDPTAAELAAKGLNPNQVRAYQNLRRGLERAWDEYLVPMAAKVGIELPKKIPGYVPMMWFGDYRVWGKNRVTGKYDFVYGVESMRQANTAIAELTKRFGKDYEFRPQDVTNVHNEFTAVAPAFLDAIRLMGNNSPEGQAMLQAMKHILATRGASKHRLHRNEDLTKGYAGSLEEGRSWNPQDTFARKRILNFERSIEGYVQGLVKYAKNRQLLDDLNKVHQDPKIRDFYPNAVRHSQDILGGYFGEDKFMDKWLKQTMIDYGLPTRLPETLTANVATWIMYMKVMAWRAPFYFAQSIQDVFIIPRMLMQKGMGTDASIWKAMGQGLWDWAVAGNSADAAWAIKHGVVEPKFSEQLIFTPSVKGGKPTYHDAISLVTGNSLAAWIDTSVRWRSFLTLKHFFENSGMSPEQAREAAAKNSLDAMVEYEGWKRAHMHGQLGIMGNLFSPLTTFLNNLINRGQEYGHQSLTGRDKVKNTYQASRQKNGTWSVKEGGSHPVALISLAAVIATLAGSAGFPGRGEWDTTVDAANKILGTSIPTATDMLIDLSEKFPRDQKFAHDLAIFGAPSAITGYNLSGTLGAPDTLGTILPGFADPMPKFLWDNATKGGSVIAKSLAGGEISHGEGLDALKAATPTAPVHGLLENAHSTSTRGKPWYEAMMPQDHDVIVPDKNADGRFKRTPNEQIARNFGLKSTDEAMFDMKQRRLETKKYRMQARRSDAVEVAADQFAEPKERSSEVLRKQANKYIENGGDIKRWSGEILENLHRRYNTYTERELLEALKGRNPRSLKLLQEHGLLRGERGGFQKMSGNSFDEAQKEFEKEFRELDKRAPTDGWPHFDVDKRDKRDRIIRKLPDGKPEGLPRHKIFNQNHFDTLDKGRSFIDDHGERDEQRRKRKVRT